MLRHLYFYTYVDRSFGELRRTLGGVPARWLPPPATPQDGGWRVMLDAGSALPRAVSTREAVVTVDELLTDAHGIAVLRGIRWQATEREEWFPTLDGDVELTEVSRDCCQISLRGTYRPPLSVVGAVGDRLVGHRVAEAVVRRFVLAVADRLERLTV